ncbi:uncharacterized protein PHACADRAFT_94710 [Phanerochaete carnosa HHB-10118-sp]|uniref:CS domain-containing protein n=1 Tax=Phanerochaete carnosa (strain HHB-10118-sp) TaxID=650164 RepID=K5W923_PHACS|nr:uncharacterized protein PHACADRAFT_94710 [Phanerochaete carnosa HHB-10118-sp]EKM55469.1 hypothetical protein PHACADRAFT_94710 [Phanerochaete carnosa HHB-10118-sp]
MGRCTNKGCNQDFDPENNPEGSCTFHPGAPVFHEGLKSWSCCQDVNKPVLDFDDFMKITVRRSFHTAQAPKPETPKPVSNATVSVVENKAGQETYITSVPAAIPITISTPATPPPPLEEKEEEDDLSVDVPVGTACRHKGCGKTFISSEVSRLGEGEEAVCIYHPKQPIFHEGSKGYLCCRRRVLEFEEFLKIEGCKRGKHLFAPKDKPSNQEEEHVTCRIDHYQTPTEIHVSVFAKQADRDRSAVKIASNEIAFDLVLPGPKRFRRSIELFGPIDPEASSYKYYGTKVELILRKADNRSWAVLEKTDRTLPISFTFGVGGRTGTIGAKELILDDQNATRART